ncbi:MAG TPA: 6-bladed beta-propeller [Solirubrobacterales bacterium]|nr:6-bladed beta-propeller [Solirubrobacterales bacterium]
MPSSRIHLLVSLAFLAAAALLLSTAATAVAVPFCEVGSGPGQCDDPEGIAVDNTLNRVYVADRNNNRVNVFDEAGTFISSFGSLGSGPGELTVPQQVAVDDDPTSPNFGDVYVTDAIPRVQRYSSTGAFEATVGAGILNWSNPQIAVIPGGDLYVIDSAEPGVGFDIDRQVKIFDTAGVLIGSSTIGPGLFYDATVDSTGVVYVSRERPDGTILVEKYETSEPTATLLDSFDPGIDTFSLAVDSADNLYFGQYDVRGVQPRRIITKRDPSGTVVRRFGYDEVKANVRGLAAGVGDYLFGTEENGPAIRIDQPGPGAYACCLGTDLGNTKATLEGQINPEGKEAIYHFEYLTEAKWVANDESFTGPNLPSETPESDPVGSDFELHPAEAEIGCAVPQNPPQPECLTPGTAYRYRLVATNADGSNFAEGQFTTKRPFELLETYATEAGTSSVRLNATVNPLGIPATARFEYVADAAYQADKGGGGDGFAEATQTPSIDLGSDDEPKAISVLLSGLTPGTTYHYRTVVANASVSETGPERTVTTFPLPTQPTNACPNAIFRTGPSALLPGCRAYEMVSPVDKNGGDIKVLGQAISFPARLDQSADSGEAFTYSSVTAFAGALSAPWSSQYMARRGTDGWSTEAINPPRQLPKFTDNPILTLDVQYRMFSDDLGEAWLSTDTGPSLDECAPEGFLNLYRRDNATGTYEALVPRKPSNLDKVPDYRLELQGLSADGSRSVFRASAKLTKDAQPSGQVGYQLYEHVRDSSGETCGQLRLVSIAPDGTALTNDSSVGSPAGPAEYREGMVSRGVSQDGTRVFFTNGGEVINGPLLVRINADQPQSAISGGECTEPDKGCTLQISTEATQFWTAALDGSRVVYSVGDDLFEYDVDKALAGEAPRMRIAGGLPERQLATKGVAASDAEASRIYFVSEETIEGEGEAGTPNLYLYEPAKAGSERYRLVAKLDVRDLDGFRLLGTAVGTAAPVENGVRVSADGRYLAFVSNASLTSYDKADAVADKPTIQVYLYDAVSEELRCVSCNPSGARPQGRRFEQNQSTIRYVSAMMPPGESQTFSPRVLAEDGSHLFFESFEALLPRDTNGKADAYQWQRAGSQAQCNAVGAELYVHSSGGCLSLISTGQSPSDTEIADATPDGSSVFLRTAESLLPQDPGQVDVYVARVNGGFPQAPSQPAACEGEACQGPIAPPDHPTPGSLGFQGAGNVNERAAKPKPRCAKGKVRRKGRCVKKKKSSNQAGKQNNKNRRQGR